MVQFLSIIFFLGFLQFLLGFSKDPVFLCHSVYNHIYSHPRVPQVELMLSEAY